MRMMSADARAADDGIRFLEGGKSAGMSQRFAHEKEGRLDLHTILVAATVSLLPKALPNTKEDKTMLASVTDLQGFTLRAMDGEIGKVDQFYFDDETWAIRYLVVNTGSWLAGRLVLISPIAVGRPDCKAARGSTDKKAG